MEKIKEAYLDSSVFITSALETSLNARKSREIISSVGRQAIAGYTATLTFDEVVFIVRKFAGFNNSLAAGEGFLNISHLKFIEVTYESILIAQELIKKYKIKPRDAIHAACAINKSIKTLISDDADFDVIKEIERKSIKEFKI